MPTLLSINGQPISFGGAVWSLPDAGADVTAPTLDVFALTATGATTATGTVTTKEDGGTVYAYISTSGTPPSAATVKASGTSQAGGTAGEKTFTFTGLTAETLYSVYYVHTDDSGNDSAVANAADTTDAAEVDDIFDGPTSTTITWSDLSAIEDNYDIYGALYGNTPTLRGTVTQNVTTYLMEGLEYSTRYAFAVKARNSAGSSDSSSGNFWTAPQYPVSAVTGEALSASSIRATWTLGTVAPLTGHQLWLAEETAPDVYSDPYYVAAVGASVDTYDFTGLESGTNYIIIPIPYNANSGQPHALGVPAYSSPVSTFVTVVDNFDGADGSLDSSWTVRFGTKLSILDGDMVVTEYDGGVSQVAVKNTPAIAENQFARITLGNINTQFRFGCAVRVPVTGDPVGYYYHHNQNTGTGNLVKFGPVGGWSTIETGVAATLLAGDTLELRAETVSGDVVVTVYHNGDLILTHTDTDDVVLGGGQPGVYIDNIGTTVLRVSNFTGGAI